MKCQWQIQGSFAEHNVRGKWFKNDWHYIKCVKQET